jgi:hypothetical protein
LNGDLHRVVEWYYSDKVTLSFDVFYREKPKSECLVPSRQPDFAGMMRPGQNQSTPFDLSPAGRIAAKRRPSSVALLRRVDRRRKNRLTIHVRKGAYGNSN